MRTDGGTDDSNHVPERRLSLYRIPYISVRGRTERVICPGAAATATQDVCLLLTKRTKGWSLETLQKATPLWNRGALNRKNTLTKAEIRVQSQFSPCGIWGAQSGNGTGFSPVLQFSPVTIIPPVLHTNFRIHAALTGRRLATGFSYTMGSASFPEVKRPERGVNHPPRLAPRLKKE